MKRVLVIVVIAVVSSLLLQAQAPQMPKPGPELKKLDYFAGKWKMEGETKPSAYGPGGKVTLTEHNEWMEGGFFLVTHSEFKGASGEGKGLAIFGYKPEDKVYTYNEFDTAGEAVAATGTVQGNNWTWQSEDKMGGKVMKSRYTVNVLSPASYTFKLEMAGDGGAWNTIMEGKATKQ